MIYGKAEGRGTGRFEFFGGVNIPKQHNSATKTFGSREDNETIKEGETPEDWKSKPAKDRQKDKDAIWTKRHRHDRRIDDLPTPGEIALGSSRRWRRPRRELAGPCRDRRRPRPSRRISDRWSA